MSHGIPAIDARTAGAFRILFGLCVVTFFASHPEGASSLNATFNPLVEGAVHATVLRWLREQPSIVALLPLWLLLTGLAFTVGLLTRLSYTLFVVASLVWVFLATVHDSTHPHSTLILTLVALLPSRWGDSLSVDDWVHRLRGRQRALREADKRYGYSVWVPGLVFGVAFAAAAWAKVVGTGPRWILNGSVKYHFITDSLNAPVDWGLQVAGHPQIAVLLSLAVVIVEALVVTAAFVRSDWYRLAMGVSALGLLVGFRLFMGVFWPGWWILLLGFVPWAQLASWLRTVGGRPWPRGLAQTGLPRPAGLPSVAQLGAITFVIAQQTVVSAIRIERAPMFTYYPMYAYTYASPEAFNASMAPYYRIMVSTASGRVELDCNAPEDLVDDLRAALDGSATAAEQVWREVRGCAGDLKDPLAVTFEGDRRAFDWNRLELRTERAAIVVGPLPSAATP
jgi:hypothetical protein